MGDKLTAAQFEVFTGRNLREKITRTLTINNDSISLTDITGLVDSWGSLKTSVYNVHPKFRGEFVFPSMTISVDPTGGDFDIGGVIFPNGRDDFKTTVARIVVVIGGVTFLDFEGAVLEPEYMPGEDLNLVLEHPLAELARREWVGEDRIGGDTGVDFYFDS